MSRRGVFTLAGVLATGVFLATASLVHAATIPVTISTSGFVPASVKVNVGDTIEFRNSTTATQSARTSLTSGFNTGDIGPNQTKTVTLNSVGTYSYSSAYTTAFTGTVEVASSSTASTTTTSTTSTTSGTTSQPANTQAQPVSGVFEVVMAMSATGVASIGGGWIWQRRQTLAEREEREMDRIIALPTVSAADSDSNQPRA